MGKLKLKAKPEAKPKAKRKNAMASAFSRLAHESMTPAQRVARGKRAAAARWHKSKPPANGGPSAPHPLGGTSGGGPPRRALGTDWWPFPPIAFGKLQPALPKSWTRRAL